MDIFKKPSKPKKYARSNHAFLAQATYEDHFERKRLGESRGYKYDPFLSDQRHATYYRNGKAYLVYRGTYDLQDAVDDLKIMTGTWDVTDELTHAQKAMDKYGRDNVVMIGHSLGGYKVKQVAKQTGLKGVVFNTFKPLYDPVQEGVLEVNHPGDLISGDYSALATEDPIQTTLKNHSIDNF